MVVSIRMSCERTPFRRSLISAKALYKTAHNHCYKYELTFKFTIGFEGILYVIVGMGGRMVGSKRKDVEKRICKCDRKCLRIIPTANTHTHIYSVSYKTVEVIKRIFFMSFCPYLCQNTHILILLKWGVSWKKMKEIVEGGVVTGHKFNHHWQIYEILNELKGLKDAWKGFL